MSRAKEPSRAEELAATLAAVESRLRTACEAAGRSRADVTLVAVGKTWPAADLRALAGLGVRNFAENRDQEARRKAAELADLGLRWHFVGRIQTNKCRSIAAYADVVHGLDRLELVAALGAAARRAGRRLDALVQVSLDGNPHRGGTPVAGVPALATAVAAEEGLRLAGVMAIPPLSDDPAGAFAGLAEVAALVRSAHPDAVAVSAGMSADLEAAVAAGSTHVRVGTALFGGREPILG